MNSTRSPQEAGFFFATARANVAGRPADETQQRVSLLEVWNGTLDLLGWIAPDLASHHASNPVVPQLINQRPQ
jgi:hypothetical protein